VQVKELAEKTLYYFTIISGGRTYDQQGSPYQVKTGKNISPSPGELSDQIQARVLQPDGKPATDIIVFMSIKDKDGEGSAENSAEQSILIWGTETAIVNFNAANSRTKDALKAFAYSLDVDMVQFRALGAAGCKADLSVCTEGKNLPPAYELTLTCSGGDDTCDDVRISNISSTSANISWVSCYPFVAEVRYGESQSLLNNECGI